MQLRALVGRLLPTSLSENATARSIGRVATEQHLPANRASVFTIIRLAARDGRAERCPQVKGESLATLAPPITRRPMT